MTHDDTKNVTAIAVTLPDALLSGVSLDERVTKSPFMPLLSLRNV